MKIGHLKKWTVGIFAVLAGTISYSTGASAVVGSVPNVNCWDGSFAYGQLKIGVDSDQPTLVNVDLQSEDQAKFLQGVDLGTRAGWGQSDIQFYVQTNKCHQSGPRPDTVTCEDNDGIIRISYDESLESRRILNLLVKELTMTTTVNGNTYSVDLSFKAGSANIAGKVHLGFPTDQQGICRHF